MSKYEPLPQFLSTGSVSTRRLSFEQIERILGFKLPKSAYKHEAWWSNNETGHSHARVWLSAGWRTKDVDIAARKVTFERERSPEAAKSSTEARPVGLHGGHHHDHARRRPDGPTGERWNAEEGRLLNE